MKTKAFSVFDSKAKCFATPFFMPTVGSAVRAFDDLANDERSAVSKHPSDYNLYEIGEFDDADGLLIAKSPVLNLGSAAEFVKKGPTEVR